MFRAYNKVYNEKYRHITLRQKYIVDEVVSIVISIVYVKSHDNLAEIFTKFFSQELVREEIHWNGTKIFQIESPWLKPNPK